MGPEHSLLAGVQVAMLGADGDLTLGRKGTTVVLEQKQAKSNSRLGDLVQDLARGPLPHLVGEFSGSCQRRWT